MKRKRLQVESEQEVSITELLKEDSELLTLSSLPHDIIERITLFMLLKINTRLCVTLRKNSYP
jgi:hypothetical protein